MAVLNLGTRKQSDSAPSGVRPIRLRQDGPQVARLLGLVFRKQVRHASYRAIYPVLGSSQDALIDRLLKRQPHVPGFVWEEDRRIVGNVTLMTSKTQGRFLVANVAVHPDYRRRGIALRLMEAVISYVKQKRGHHIVLQVEAQNSAALALYAGLDFATLGTVAQWELSYSRLKSLPVPLSSRSPDKFAGFNLRPLRKGDWAAAYHLDRMLFHPDLNWPDPPQPRTYQLNLRNWWQNFISGSSQECWIAANNQNEPVGLGAITSEWARPHQIKIRIQPDWEVAVARPLIAKLLRRLQYMRQRQIQIEQQVGSELIDGILQEAGFRQRRLLTTMRLEVDSR